MLRRVRVVSAESKIMAVKLVRELTGFGLRESLDHVEQGRSFEVSKDDAQLRGFVAQAQQAKTVLELDPPLGGFASSQHVPVEQGEWSILRYDSGPNKIAAIKLVRELTFLGLAEAKQVVEQGGVIRSSLPREQAVEIIERLREVGAIVEPIGGSRPERASEPSFTSSPSPRMVGYSSPDDDF